MSELAVVFVIIFLRVNGLIKQPLHSAALLRNGFHYLGIHTIQYARDAAHKGRLEALHVIHKLQRVTTVETCLEALEEGEHKNVLFESMSIRKI